MGGKEIQSPPNMDTNGFREENLQGKTYKKSLYLRCFLLTEAHKHLTYLGLVACSCLVWDRSCPSAAPGS